MPSRCVRRVRTHLGKIAHAFAIDAAGTRPRRKAATCKLTLLCHQGSVELSLFSEGPIHHRRQVALGETACNREYLNHRSDLWIITTHHLLPILADSRMSTHLRSEAYFLCCVDVRALGLHLFKTVASPSFCVLNRRIDA